MWMPHTRTIDDAFRRRARREVIGVPEASEFVLGLNPVIRHDGEDVAATTKPLVRYLTRALNVPVQIVVEHDYEALVAALKTGQIDAAMLGEYAFHLAQREAGAEALAVS